MKTTNFIYANINSIAFMGGTYGNRPALEACIADAQKNQVQLNVFLGDMTGCCGHSDEVVALVREHFPVVIAGNHEQEAAAGSSVCGCGYSNPEDEKYSCMAHQYAMDSLSAAHRPWMAQLPDLALLETQQGSLLLCHGSPEQTNEFLYESELDEQRLNGWLDQHQARGLICTHTGLPWLKHLDQRRFAVNCGVVGKPDHDGDPAVHYALLRAEQDRFAVEIRRVEYDHRSWVAQLQSEGVDPIFVEPLRTGLWTTGAASLPPLELKRARKGIPF